MVPRGGVVISSHAPPKTRGQPSVHRAPRERSAAAPAVCGYSMRRFLPTAGASSAFNVADDPQVLEDEIELELRAVEEDLAHLDVEDDDVLSEEEGGGGRPESCITSSITEAEVHSRFEENRSYLYAKGRGGEYSETQYLLSKAVHSFTHVMKLKSSVEGRSGGRCRQLFAIYGRGRAFLVHNHCCCATKVLVVFGTRML